MAPHLRAFHHRGTPTPTPIRVPLLLRRLQAHVRGRQGNGGGRGEIEAAAESGYPAAQSVLGFLWGMGLLRERSKGKAFLYHHFAAEGGNMQSKMALAYTYTRQDMFDKAVKLYAELAEVAVNSFLISKDSPVIEPVRLHNGAEENKEALRKSKGEEDEDFQILEYQAQKGNAAAMYKVGLFYYFGLRGLRRDHSKALSWFLKAVEKGEPRSMELLGEIYAREQVLRETTLKPSNGLRLHLNTTSILLIMGWAICTSKAMESTKRITLKSGMSLVCCYGVHLYCMYAHLCVIYDIFGKLQAKEYFEKAADNEEVGGHYNLGVMYLKGIGVKRDVKLACKFFIVAANHGQPKAFYQLAKIFHIGVGFKKNIPLATALYKLVAERGPWSSLSRWALESYLKGDVGKAFMLYSRMAEMGYEVAQSNAAWILDKYGERSMCMGESGFCTDAERHQRAHSLWWQASEQGNEHAALLIGDAYYYGRVRMIDSLPDVYPKLEAWVENVLLEEGNATILTLFACLLTVLYLRERQRRQAAVVAGEVAQQNRPNEFGVPAPAPI
ncbi:Tetratricopeptide-like helical domain superfamily [Sesbania bispinosa]|nr:Tetratricopeptide-like helical domain superfamily [Sesbania bispinosa]